jgi:hypothetical protein
MEMKGGQSRFEDKAAIRDCALPLSSRTWEVVQERGTQHP